MARIKRAEYDELKLVNEKLNKDIERVLVEWSKDISVQADLRQQRDRMSNELKQVYTELRRVEEKLAQAMPYVKGTEAIGDAIIQAGFADNAAEVGSVSAHAVSLIWKYG